MLYGYAFRSHWFWINNYRDSRVIILWKDYNFEQPLNFNRIEADRDEIALG